MLVRDVSGRLIALPEPRIGYVPVQGYDGYGLGYYGEPVYDGLGNPLGLPFLAALAPLAAKILPMAGSLLPKIIGGASKILPIVSKVAGGVQQAVPLISQAISALPMPAPAPVPAPLPPGPGTVVRTESVVTPVRVQGPTGQPMVVPVRVRRRRRVRAPVPRLAGYPGFHGYYGHPGLHGWHGY